MTWVSLACEAPGVLPGSPRFPLLGIWSTHPMRTGTPAPRARRPMPGAIVTVPASLGTASSTGRWQWASIGTKSAQSALPARETAAVRIPHVLLEEMSLAASTCGQSLSDIWAEAAREWLAQHAREDEPQPPTPAGAALAIPRPMRSWAAIDAALAALRESSPAAPAA